MLGKILKINYKFLVEAELTIEHLEDSNTRNRNTNLNLSEHTVKLPIIVLPLFYGSYEQWIEFSDGFRALIHTNVTICLRDKAASILSSLSVSETIYD